jgi:glycerate-2-kinase
MRSSLRGDIEQIYHAALEPVRADEAVRANLSWSADSRLAIAGQVVEIGDDGVYAVSIGKAAVAMVFAAADVIGTQFTAGIAVTKSEASSCDPRIRVMQGSHPVPDEQSLTAGAEVLRFAGAVPDGALVLCLISGGGSALVESLREGVDLARLRELTSRLLREGASIHELNAVRSRLSQIKAGGLLRALSRTRVHNLIVSDVLGDDVRTIASGPTVPLGNADAEAVMRKYGMPGSIPERIEAEELTMPPTTIIANLSAAVDAAAGRAAALGYTPVVLSRSLDGEAREVGRLLATIVADCAAAETAFGQRSCLLAGGETTVTVRGDGVGGRNTEAALAAAIRLAGVENTAIGFLATDGDDGASGASGGIVDGTTVAANERSDALEALAKNDSYTFLRERGAALSGSQTGTNVNDLVIGLIGSRKRDRKRVSAIVRRQRSDSGRDERV